MIQATFQMGGDMIVIEVKGNDVVFFDKGNNLLSPIEGLRFNRAGVIKEFPDLEFDNEWRAKAIERFRDKIKSFGSEDKAINYIITDLKKHGYSPLFKQRAGWRPERIK
jgi:hypothetical protein